MVEAVVDAIDDGTVGEDRCKTAPAGLDHLVFPAHIQETLVLAGKARGRQVFGGRRTAHCDGSFGAAFLFELAISRGDFLAQLRIAGRVIHQLSSRSGALSKHDHIVMVEAGQQPAQFVFDAGCGKCRAIGLRR